MGMKSQVRPRRNPMACGESLNKVVKALMGRAERLAMDTAGSDFGLFQKTIHLEEKVRSRTQELRAALKDSCARLERALLAAARG